MFGKIVPVFLILVTNRLRPFETLVIKKVVLWFDDLNPIFTTILKFCKPNTEKTLEG